VELNLHPRNQHDQPADPAASCPTANQSEGPARLAVEATSSAERTSLCPARSRVRCEITEQKCYVCAKRPHIIFFKSALIHETSASTIARLILNYHVVAIQGFGHLSCCMHHHILPQTRLPCQPVMRYHAHVLTGETSAHNIT
jgi:hypothetical protein